MKITSKILLIALFAMVLPFAEIGGGLYAQTEPEYQMEIGGAVGLTSYQGDFDNSILKGQHPSITGMWRRLLNPRQGFKVELGLSQISGSSDKVNTFYPNYSTGLLTPDGTNVYEFKKTLVDLNGTYEQNFWPYGTGREYRGAKRLTPYVFIGLGFTLATGNSNSAFTANVPIGVGVKYKIGDRLNLDINWAMHLSMSDKLDGCKDPYLVESSGLFKNTDCYSCLKVGLTYSFKEKCRVCHNSDE